MINDIYKDAQQRMQKSIVSLEEDLGKHRTGRASPNLLSDVKVSYYGNLTPLNQVASVVVESALLLVVKPWERNMMPAIEKAILSAGLGLNPASSTDIIRVPLPPLTEERRKGLIKLVRADGENAKIAIRNIRRDANNHVKDLLKEKAITEDDERRSFERVQKLTDEYIEKADTVLAEKEKELMEI